MNAENIAESADLIADIFEGVMEMVGSDNNETRSDDKSATPKSELDSIISSEYRETIGDSVIITDSKK